MPIRLFLPALLARQLLLANFISFLSEKSFCEKRLVRLFITLLYFHYVIIFSLYYYIFIILLYFSLYYYIFIILLNVQLYIVKYSILQLLKSSIKILNVPTEIKRRKFRKFTGRKGEL